MTEPEYDAILVGAGHNGLVTAYYLAKEGLSVLVLERIERVGGGRDRGALSGLPRPLLRLHLPHAPREDHRRPGAPPAWVRPLSGRPWSFHPFPDGTDLLGWQDTKKFVRELRRLSAHDAEAYPDWVSFWDRACGIVYRYFLADPPTFAQVAADVRGTADEVVWETMLTVPVRDLLDEHFEHPRVKAYFACT